MSDAGKPVPWLAVPWREKEERGARILKEYPGDIPSITILDASSGAVLSARSDTWRFFDFIWGLHIMDWTQRDRINSWWLLLFGIGGTIIAISGFVLLANRFPRTKRRARHGQVAR